MAEPEKAQQGERVTPLAAGSAARRRGAALHAVTVKQDHISLAQADVFVRVDVTAATPAQAEEQLRIAYGRAKNQLAALALTEQYETPKEGGQ